MRVKAYLTIYRQHWTESLWKNVITKNTILSFNDASYTDDTPGPVPCMVGAPFPGGCVDDEGDLGPECIIIEFEKNESEIIYVSEEKDCCDAAVNVIYPKEITRIARGLWVCQVGSTEDVFT